ncbi:hypothetical protein TRFO_18748 [Tritrichomonas foetus]|uniref:Uncharacterized protein n=1 Tax=Tritrichomonas foetus TaxID=1144522 RepID=A0A1J4KKD2_9EUKA|nr:hypothetical protein TRFO_18748 [Tritrichomonas foetus]|eukprot:OHT11761.1 hypothetical protein TRFO_18748 [Tritrichomonas foetus]
MLFSQSFLLNKDSAFFCQIWCTFKYYFLKMDGESMQKRISSLASYLRSSVEQLLRDKLILQLTGATVNSAELSQNMVNVFQTTLTSEREKYIDELIAKLSKIKSEKNSIENEFTQIQSSNNKDTDVIIQENEQLKVQIESLEAKLKSTEWKQNNKEKNYKRQLKEKDGQASQVKTLIDSTQNAQHVLSQQLREIRSSFSRLQRNQVRLIGQAKTMCTSQINESVELNASALKNNHTKQVSHIVDTINKEKKMQHSIEIGCQQLIESLNCYASGSIQHLDFSSDEFSSHVGEIRDFIDDIIETRKKAAIDDLKRQVAESIPGIEIGNQNVTDAIDRHLKARIKAKEAECQRLLQESEQREALLRQKLKEALERIQKLQSSESDYKYIDEFEKQKMEWENTRKKLDQTMIVVNKTRTITSKSSSRSVTSDE